jgi:plasmid stabilization system protein ParE
MARRIVWNKRALEKFDEIVDYLGENFSEKAASNFVRKVFDRLDILSRYPEIGRKSKKNKNIQFHKIDKNRDLYYRVDGEKLIIVYIFDTRQNPEKNPN